MGSSSPGDVSLKLQRIAELARSSPGMVITTLAHHIDLDWLREAHRRTRKDGAVGVDRQTADEYAEQLEENLQSLLDRFKSGDYFAPPVRRVHIPKGDGRSTRPIGIPTFEDKVLQRAVSMALEAVYEQDFLDCSYGFRPGRSAHQALQALWEGLQGMRGGWVLDVDVQDFFGSLDHGHLRSFLNQRVRDGVLRRAIDKWLKAGVLEEGRRQRSEEGTPQGGVISPVLANIYLHDVLDLWFPEEVLERLAGEAFLIRYADDVLLVFEREQDARLVRNALTQRLARFGLRLHPDKTRLVRFVRPPEGGTRKPRRGSVAESSERPGTFDFLGFTHYWGRSRKGRGVVRRRTGKDRLVRVLRSLNAWLRRHRHRKVREQHEALCRKLRGHYAYYGITGNAQRLESFLWRVTRMWRYWLNRRSQGCHMPWHRFRRLLERYPLPPIRVVHSVYRNAANP